MSASPECVPQAPQTEEETPKETSPPSQCLVNIGQGGPDGDEDDEREAVVCRICYEGERAGRLVSLCRCKGSMGHTHVRCLERWLDVAQKTRCELCGFSYPVELTRRYAVLPSLRVWAREEADTRLLAIDLLTVLIVTPVIGAYVYLSVRGIVDLAKGPVGIDPNETTTEALTVIGLMVLCVAIVICFVIWVCITFAGMFREWHDWWSTCYRIRLLPTAVNESQRPTVPTRRTRRTDSSSLQRIFSRGAFHDRRNTV